MTARPQIRELAQRFLVWRAGKAHEWFCTHRDIAAETGLGENAVRRICRNYGYRLERGDDSRIDRTMPVDRFFAAAANKDRSHY